MSIELLWKELIAGKLDLTLPFCRVAQRIQDSPIIHLGIGLATQGDDGHLCLRVFSPMLIDDGARSHRQQQLNAPHGSLPPDAFGFDIVAADMLGREWHSRWQNIEEHCGTGTEVRISLSELAKVEPYADEALHRSMRWLIPGEFELPQASDPVDNDFEPSTAFSWSDNSTTWLAKLIDGGLDLTFAVSDGDLMPRATHFLWAMAILLGRSLDPLITHYAHDGNLITLVRSRDHALEKRRLRTPISHQHWIPAKSAIEFIHCFVRMPHPFELDVIGPLGVIFQFWHRILRANEHDVENSALIVSVSIEGLIRELFHSDIDTDHEFVELCNEARQIVRPLDVSERIRGMLLNALGNANRFRPKDVLQRLVEQGAINKLHISAWTDLRNSGAHGSIPDPGDASLQRHLDRYHRCLDLFYRLMFVAIGYRGLFRDRCGEPWQTRTYPPTTNDTTLLQVVSTNPQTSRRHLDTEPRR
jgi:hypothetical protein